MKILLPNGETIEKPEPDSFLCILDYFRNILVHLPLKDRLGGAKADRRKEAAISTAVETYLRNHQSERADGRMSRGKMVLFFKFCFPLFLEIVLKVIRQESTKGKIPSFKNDSVFSNSSKIPYIETTDH